MLVHVLDPLKIVEVLKRLNHSARTCYHSLLNINTVFLPHKVASGLIETLLLLVI